MYAIFPILLRQNWAQKWCNHKSQNIDKETEIYPHYYKSPFI